MKLEVGMYVRILKGVVKIEKILDGVMWDTQGHLHFGDFIKASHNIIDLIEVGDYVNGYKATYVYPNLIKVDSADIWEIHINDIKSIVTKEQFEQMEYKVGE